MTVGYEACSGRRRPQNADQAGADHKPRARRLPYPLLGTARAGSALTWIAGQGLLGD